MTHYPRQPDSADRSARSWHRTRPAAGDQRIPQVFWLLVLALACLALVCVTLGASAALARKGTEKPLLAGHFLPKLFHSHGERKANASHISETPPSAWDRPKDGKTTVVPSRLPLVVEQAHGGEWQLPPLATTEPPVQPLVHTAAELVLPSLPETCDDPVIYLHPCRPQRGDTPMIRNWKTLTLYSLLSAAAVVYVPQPTAVAGAPKTDPAVDELTKSIQELTKRIKALEDKKSEAVDYGIINRNFKKELDRFDEGLMAQFKKVSDDIKSMNESIGSVKEEQVKLKLKLGSLEAALEMLESQRKKGVAESPPPMLPALDKAAIDQILARLTAIENSLAKSRTSMSPPINGAAAPTPTGARVKLDNYYTSEVTFVVNGVAHRVPPRFHKIIENVPPGMVEYQVFALNGIVDSQATTLEAGQMLSLTAYPSR